MARVTRSQLGFTLIELMLAVVLLALLTGAAAMTFARPIRNARAQQAIELVCRSDAMARENARRFGRPGRITFDLHDQVIRRSTGPDHTLPTGYQIREVRTAERGVVGGEISLDVSSKGLSRSYAVHLIGPGMDRWLLVAGLSGEVSQTDESQLQQIFKPAAGNNAR